MDDNLFVQGALPLTKLFIIQLFIKEDYKYCFPYSMFKHTISQHNMLVVTVLLFLLQYNCFGNTITNLQVLLLGLVG